MINYPKIIKIDKNTIIVIHTDGVAITHEVKNE